MVEKRYNHFVITNRLSEEEKTLHETFIQKCEDVDKKSSRFQRGLCIILLLSVAGALISLLLAERSVMFKNTGIVLLGVFLAGLLVNHCFLEQEGKWKEKLVPSYNKKRYYTELLKADELLFSSQNDELFDKVSTSYLVHDYPAYKMGLFKKECTPLYELICEEHYHEVANGEIHIHKKELPVYELKFNYNVDTLVYDATNMVLTIPYKDRPYVVV